MVDRIKLAVDLQHTLSQDGVTLTLRPVPRRISTSTKSSVRRVRTSGNVGSN